MSDQRTIWKDIIDNAGTDKTDIVAAFQSRACFFANLDARNWTDARACVDDAITATDLTTDQGNYVKGKIPT